MSESADLQCLGTHVLLWGILQISFDCEDKFTPESEDVDVEDTEEPQHGYWFVADIEKADISDYNLCVKCLAFDGHMMIEDVKFANVDEEGVGAYEGPKFEDLDESLQEALRVHLAERDIGDGLAEFVTEFAEVKEQRDYVDYLKKMRRFA